MGHNIFRWTLINGIDGENAKMSMVAGALPARKEVAEDLKWDLSPVYKDDTAWEADFASVAIALKELSRYKGTLADKEQLLQFFRLRDKLAQQVETLYVYSHLRADEDTTNSHYQAMNDRALALYTQFGEEQSWANPELLAMDEAQLRGIVGDGSDKAGLGLYRQKIDELLRQKQHVRNPEIEELLAQYAQVAQGPRTVFTMLDNADLKLPQVLGEDGEMSQLTHGNYIVYLQSRDWKVRKSAYLGMMSAFESMRNTIAANYASQVKTNIFEARARNYKSALEAALGPDNVPVSVYHNLIESAHRYLPVLRRYLDLRKKVLAQAGELPDGKLHMWDLYVPVIKDVQYDITYGDACKKVLASVNPLGMQYAQVLAKGLGSRWIDVVENKGKRSGAYSSGCYGTPPYMLLNWQDNLENMFTLAHEAGHSMHSWFTRDNQPYVYGDYTIFVAEVASTCNEALLTHHLLQEEIDDNLRAYLINHQLEAFRTTFFRQTLFAEFEMIAHRDAENGVALTADHLSKIFLDLNKKYYGEMVEDDDAVKIEWARIPHFYNSFYVYKYATGISAATALSRQILQEGQPACDRYLGFLKKGSSDYSINILRDAGVDLAEPSSIDQALDVFEDFLQQFERALGQGGK
jgi:oligoendopeptidase F